MTELERESREPLRVNEVLKSKTRLAQAHMDADAMASGRFVFTSTMSAGNQRSHDPGEQTNDQPGCVVDHIGALAASTYSRVQYQRNDHEQGEQEGRSDDERIPAVHGQQTQKETQDGEEQDVHDGIEVDDQFDRW